MASSSSDPSSQIPQEFKDLFSWNPPQLFPHPHPGTTLSDTGKTRSPAFFDRHLSDNLKLLHVKLLPSLVHDLAAVVDSPISYGSSQDRRFFSAENTDVFVTRIGTDMTDEKAVAGYYDKTTGLLCSGAASILALGSPYLLEWTQSGNVPGYAIAEGFIRFANIRRAADLYTQLEVLMDKETVTLIQSLANKNASLATFVFKNLADGGPEVMLAIPKLSHSPKFDWTTCTNPDCPTLENHARERRKVLEVESNMGRDAKSTPWNLDDCSSNQVEATIVQGSSKHVGTSRGSKRKRVSDRNDDSQAGSSSPNLGVLLIEPQANLSLVPEASDVPQPTKPLPRRSARVQKQNVPQSMQPQWQPVVKGKGKVAAKEKGAQGREITHDSLDSSHPSYKDKHDLSALDIVTQAWAQATRVDSSIIVIQSGNHEFIGIRHRDSQTLYLSDEIVPHACKEPSYGKLHVGIYMAAIRDVIDRERQRVTGSGDSNDGGEGLSDNRASKKRKKADEKKPKDGSSSGSGGMKAIPAQKMATMESTLELASRRNVLLVWLQYGIYDSPAPATFIRLGPLGQPLPSRKTVRNYKPEECLTAVLTSEIGHGGTGDVLRGTLEVEESPYACVPLDVAVKLAFSSNQRDGLRNEYSVYQQLMKSGVNTGITPLGLFDDVEGAAVALVMPYVGVPLADQPELDLPIAYRKTILETLEKIHQANILHDDIRLDNILVADSGLTLIDFSHSRECYDEDAKNREYSQLRSLLRQHAKKVKC